MEAVGGSGKAYLVRRRTDSWVNGRLTAGTVVRAFTDRTAAEAFCEQSERQARLDRRVVAEVLTDPEFVRSPFELTSFDPPVFRDWLEDAGIPAPPAGARWTTLECVEWWEGCRDLSDLQLVRLFEALDKFRFCEITEVVLAADGRRAPLPEYDRLLGGEGRPEWREERHPGNYDPQLDGPPDQSEQYDGDDIPF
jgi:hypothetical protein